MKTALKSVALCLLISSSCGFASPIDASQTPPTAPAAAAQGFGCMDLLKIAAAVYAFELVADGVQHYILAPLCKNPQNVATKTLEEIRKLLDTNKTRNATK